MSNERAKLETMMPEFDNLVKVFRRLSQRGIDLVNRATERKEVPELLALEYLDVDITLLEAKEINELTKR